MENKDPYFNQCILCQVKECIYQNAKDNRCNLSKILVGNNDTSDKETFCKSYEKRCD